MTRRVTHRFSENKRLFDYSSLSSMNNCDSLVVCLSERSLNIILNSLWKVEEMRTRLYTEREGESYLLANDSQFEEFRLWLSQVHNELGSWVVCNQYLERIAIALEEANQAADEQTLNLKDVFEAMGISPTESEADILEALEYLLSIPGIDILPNFKVPNLGFISGFMESRYRAAHLQLLRDIAFSQRGQAVAQGGVDFAALWDTVGETADSMIKPAGLAGLAYSFYRWKDNDQIAGWAGWVTIISGLVLGSIRNGIYDIVETIQGWVFPDYTAAIEGIELTCASGSHSASSGCGCSGGSGSAVDDQPSVGQPETPGGGPGGYEPPVTWEGTTEEYNLYKCKASNFVYEACYNALNYMAGASAAITTVGGGIATGSSILTALLGSGAAYTAAGGVMLFAFVPGWVIGAIVAIIAGVAFVTGWGVLTVASWVADEFELGKQQLICDLYNSPDIETARGHLELALADAVANMVIDAPFSAWESVVRAGYAEVVGWFVPNSLLNTLFEENLTVSGSYSGGTVDCHLCSDNCWIGESIEIDGEQVDISSTTTAEGQYIRISFPVPTTINVSLLSGTMDTPPTVPDCRTLISYTNECEDDGCGGPGWDEVLATHSTGSIPGIKTVLWRSTSVFRLRITY